MKSNTCFGKQSGQALTVYDSESEAQSSAEHANAQYGRDLMPYECRTCGDWHLSPRDRQTPTTKCSVCTGADGSAKDSYQSKAQAKRRSEIINEEHGIRLYVYQCDHGNGWHLTKSAG